MDGLVQDCSISSVLAMEILQSCTKPLIYLCYPFNISASCIALQFGYQFWGEMFRNNAVYVSLRWFFFTHNSLCVYDYILIKYFSLFLSLKYVFTHTNWWIPLVKKIILMHHERFLMKDFIIDHFCDRYVMSLWSHFCFLFSIYMYCSNIMEHNPTPSLLQNNHSVCSDCRCSTIEILNWNHSN